jgi:hypothetical protein
MPQSVRQFWFGLKGRNVLNHNWDAIDHDSVVLISVSEFNFDGFTDDHHRFVGAATITVCNISPHGPQYDQNHGVQFAVQIDWETPLNIVTDITVLDKPVDVEPPAFGYGPGAHPDGSAAG